MPDRPKNTGFLKVCNLMIAVGVLNGLMFVAGATYLGGDAVNGKVEGGHYYVFGVRTESGRKVYTEVSERVFTYSKWHAYSTLVTGLLLLAAAFASNRYRKRLSGR